MQVLESATELVAFMQTASAGLDMNVEADAVEDDAEVPQVRGFPAPATSCTVGPLHKISPLPGRARLADDKRMIGLLVMQREDAPLYKVMACLLDVKKRSGRTEASFGPLQDTVRLPTLGVLYGLS